MNRPLTASQRSLRSRVGAYSLHARRDARETTAAARLVFLSRFETLVDPERLLPEGERARRAASARRAYFLKLALRSAKKRVQASEGSPQRSSSRDPEGKAIS